jgi:hypothetical protein
MAAPQKDPLGILALNVFCDLPDVKDLTPEQRYALHQFFHEVMAAGYKLYQIVPPKLAAPIVKKKFGLMIEESKDC